MYHCYSQAENSKSMPERVAEAPAVPRYPHLVPAPISTASCTEVCGLENTNVRVSWIWAAKEKSPPWRQSTRIWCLTLRTTIGNSVHEDQARGSCLCSLRWGRDQKALVQDPVSGRHYPQNMLGTILCGWSQFYRAHLACPNAHQHVHTHANMHAHMRTSTQRHHVIWRTVFLTLVRISQWLKRSTTKLPSCQKGSLLGAQPPLPTLQSSLCWSERLLFS